MFALILLLQVGSTTQPAAVQAESDPKKLAAIEGRVLNAKTGVALRRVNVALHSFNSGGRSGTGTIGFAVPPTAPYAATTDAEGKFRIERIEPGSYRMIADRQGFVRSEYGSRGAGRMGAMISVDAGQELRNMELKLVPQAVVSGRVLDEEGEPLARVQIQLLRRMFAQGRHQLLPAGGGMTLDTGEFRIPEIAPGRYWINATYLGNPMFGELAARNPAGKPEEAYITTYYPNASDQASARHLDIQAGQELPGIDIRMQKARVFRVRGKVTGPQSTARNLQITLLPRQSPPFFGFRNSSGVKEDGSFEIGNVQPGAYNLAAMVMHGPMTIIGKMPVEVGDQDLDKVVFALTGTSTLSGSIRIDGDVQTFERRSGKRLSLDSIRLQCMPINMIVFGNTTTTAKEDGTFNIENIAPDSYRLVTMGLPQGVYLKAIRMGEQDVTDSGFEIVSGAPATVQVTLGVGVGEVSGIVRNREQQAAAGIVSLVSDPLKQGRMDLHRMTSGDQKGQFTIKNLPPGDYKLYAWEDVEPGSLMDPEFLKAHESRAHRLTIKVDGQEQVTLTQIPADAIAAATP
ncbi:MAG: carboxypeptidase regulatory-like domain-containing protein [Bryobacterales bacterium]|nr:carboxypeptidase regulatory-like domain-containing protein [Bryobacterales bacterium]